MQLLHNRQSHSDHRTIKDNEAIQSIVQQCNYLPFAVDKIISLHVEGFTDWKQLSTIISKQDLPAELKDLKFNLFGLLELSINQLNQREKQLLRLLGAFKAESIPIQSIMSIWNMNETETVALLQRYHRKSLLEYNENR